MKPRMKFQSQLEAVAMEMPFARTGRGKISDGTTQAPGPHAAANWRGFMRKIRVSNLQWDGGGPQPAEWKEYVTPAMKMQEKTVMMTPAVALEAMTTPAASLVAGRASPVIPTTI